MHHSSSDLDDDQQVPLLSHPSSSTASATSSTTTQDQCPSHHHPQLTANVSRKLQRRTSIIGAPTAGERRQGGGHPRPSVYRWLNVRRLDRSRLLIFTMCLSFVVYIVFSSFAWLSGIDDRPVVVRVPFVADSGSMDPTSADYLVSSAQCIIPALDPLAADVMQLFHRQTYAPCSERPPLTYVNAANVPTVRLHVNTSLLGSYNRKARIDHCCYQRIERAGHNATADSKFKLGVCVHLALDRGGAVLPDNVEFVLVRCKSGATAVYTNTHAIVRKRPGLERRLRKFEDLRRGSQKKNQTASSADAKRPLSVLMLAIDSISRLNLLRAMPQTAQHLYDTGWFELQGYNKIDDNTFPNLMAIMLGFNNTLAYTQCAPTETGRLDACPFIWSAFRDAGYVTAYGEDEMAISTFNYNKRGFLHPPTDYYLRPYMMAAEKNLHKQRRHSLTYCLGHQHTVDHVFQYAVDFAHAYIGQPSFGLFWTNTFSHNDISDPSAMDGKMRDYLQQLAARAVLNDTAVVFFSDHGIRFGPVRHLRTGWLEERLPFMFVWLPPWFRRAHPHVEAALRANRNRLTTPYDLHVTLRHVLRMADVRTVDGDDVTTPLSSRVDTPLTAPPSSVPLTRTPPIELRAVSCPQCQSLFEPMPVNRSCADAAIDAHWCTCTPFRAHSGRDAIVLSVVRFVLKHSNDALRQYDRQQGLGGRPRCAQLSMRAVSYAGRAISACGTEHTYLVVFEAAPGGAWFEATVVHDLSTGRFRLTGSVSRLNAYASQSECMPNDTLRKFCYCLRHARG